MHKGKYNVMVAYISYISRSNALSPFEMHDCTVDSPECLFAVSQEEGGHESNDGIRLSKDLLYCRDC